MTVLNVCNQQYEIDSSVWDCYCKMHPIRTNNAFGHFVQLSFLIPNEEITSSKIEQYIIEEYNFVSHLDETIQRARDMYECLEKE